MEMTLFLTNPVVMRRVARSVVYVSMSSMLLGLGGCGYYASRTAHKAQVTMIGMTEQDVQACAGIPTKTQTIDDHVKIFEYQRGRNIGTATTSTLIPVQSVVNIVRDVGGGDGNSCIADFRIVDGRVRDVYYSGDDDMLVGTDGVCSSVVRGCVRRAVPSGSPPNFWKTSAFIQPQPDKKAVVPGVPAPTTGNISGAASTTPTGVTGAELPVKVLAVTPAAGSSATSVQGQQTIPTTVPATPATVTPTPQK